jgi:hypothetical protein
MQVLTRVHRRTPHRTPLDLQTVYVENEGLQVEDGRRRISLSSWRRAGRAATSQASEKTQREGDAAIAVRSPSNSQLPQPALLAVTTTPSTRAVTTHWPQG